MQNAPFDVDRAHRWFAVELNNLSWDIVEADKRTPDEIERMIHAAHGACFHWLYAGDLINHLRAQSLLASAYITAGYEEAACRHAEKCLALSHEAGDSQTSFDRASAHGGAALAYRLAQQHQPMQAQINALQAAFATLEDIEEIEVIQRLYLKPLGI